MSLNRMSEFERFKLNQGDILVSLTGDVGRVGIFPEELLPALLNQRVGRFKAIDYSQLNDRFFFHVLNSDFFEERVRKTGKGTAQKNTSTKKMALLTIPVPPLEEQMAIVARLEALSGHRDEVVAKCKKELIDLDEMRQSILEQAFEGKLT